MPSMFDQELQDLQGRIWVDVREAKECQAQGVSIQAGNLPLAYEDAVQLVRRLNKALRSVQRVHIRRRLETVRNSICFCFGPEFEAAHRYEDAAQ